MTDMTALFCIGYAQNLKRNDIIIRPEMGPSATNI